MAYISWQPASAAVLLNDQVDVCKLNHNWFALSVLQPTPDNTQGECKNACVDCDIASFVDDITATCADAPGSLVGANIYCQAKNTGNPLFTATPASVLLDGSTGDFDCTEMGKVSSFEFTVTDTGDCKNQPLTCKVSGYTAG